MPVFYDALPIFTLATYGFKVKYFSLDETNVLRIIVTNSNGDDIITTKEHLRSPSNPDVGWIPSSVP